jgi:hypothetical protein
MTKTIDPELAATMEAEHEREIEVIRADLLADIAAAQDALRRVQRSQSRLVDLYDVEHAEGGHDFVHFLEEAGRALRVAEALNPTRLGYSRPQGCEICGHRGGRLVEHAVADPRAPRVVCQDTRACGERCTAQDARGDINR